VNEKAKELWIRMVNTRDRSEQSDDDHLNYPTRFDPVDRSYIVHRMHHPCPVIAPMYPCPGVLVH
jgi:hypothetical protein